MAHQLGAFGVPHGQAVGALLGPSIRFNSGETKVRRRYDHLARGLGLGDATGLASACDTLRQTVGHSERLIRDDATRRAVFDQLPEMLDGARHDICYRANPRPADDAAMTALLEQVL
jgi:alcohol dehydrogenase class IV